MSKTFGLLGILLVFLNFGFSTLAWASLDNTDSRHPQRQYRRFLLPNQMKVLLISDPVLQRGAASMTVGTGSIHDPSEFQGLAHFLEHMLFLGTEKYPIQEATRSLYRFMTDSAMPSLLKRGPTIILKSLPTIWKKL